LGIQHHHHRRKTLKVPQDCAPQYTVIRGSLPSSTITIPSHITRTIHRATSCTQTTSHLPPPQHGIYTASSKPLREYYYSTPKQDRQAAQFQSGGGVFREGLVSNYHVARSSKKLKNGETNRDMCVVRSRWRKSWMRNGDEQESGCCYKVVTPIDWPPKTLHIRSSTVHTSKTHTTSCGWVAAAKKV